LVARGLSTPSRSSARRAAEPLNWRRLRRYTAEGVRLLNALIPHLPEFPPPGPTARRALGEVLAHCVGLAGDRSIQIDATSLDATTFGEFTERGGDGVFAELALQPDGDSALCWVEGALAHRIVDRILGGAGEPSTDSRALTEIEIGIFTYVMLRMIRSVHELGTAEVGSLLRLSRLGGAKEFANVGGNEPCVRIRVNVTLGSGGGVVEVALPETALAHLRRDAAQAPDPVVPAGLGGVPIWCRAEVGQMTLDTDDLGSLERGDVLVPEVLHAGWRDGRFVGGCLLRFSSGGAGAIRARFVDEPGSVRLRIVDFVVDGLEERGETEEIAMTGTPDEPEADEMEVSHELPSIDDGDEAAAEVPLAEVAPLPTGATGTAAAMVQGVPLTVSVEMGRVRLTVAEFSNLTEGQVLELRRPPEAPVDLVVGGRVVAQGELIDIQGELGVRISGIVA